MTLSQITEHIENAQRTHCVANLLDNFKRRCEQSRRKHRHAVGDSRFAFDRFSANVPIISLKLTDGAMFHGDDLAQLLEILLRSAAGQNLRVIHLDNPGLWVPDGMIFGIYGWESNGALAPSIASELVMWTIAFLTLIDVRELIAELPDAAGSVPVGELAHTTC